MVDAPLIITDEDGAELARLRTRAEANVMDIYKLKQNMFSSEGWEMLLQLITDQTVCLSGDPWSFYVTYNVESGHPAGLMRHLAVRIDEPGGAPSSAAVLLISQYFGFVGDLCACHHVWFENLPGGAKAMNIIQKMDIVLQ